MKSEAGVAPGFQKAEGKVFGRAEPSMNSVIKDSAKPLGVTSLTSRTFRNGPGSFPADHREGEPLLCPAPLRRHRPTEFSWQCCPN